MKMKNFRNYTIIIVSLVLFNATGFAQGKKQCRQHREQIKSERIAFLTEALDLSVKEAQSFWPVYNSYNTNIESLRDKRHSEIYLVQNREDEFSEKEYQEFLDNRISIIEDETNLKKKYQQELFKVLSAKKIFLLYKSERDFKRKLIKDFRNKKPACLND